MTEDTNTYTLKRRAFCLGAAAICVRSRLLASARETFRLRYILGSCMYGKTAIDRILREAHKTGAEHIDVWPLVHGDQREQIEKIGLEKFAKLLEQYRVKLGIFSHFDLGPFQRRTIGINCIKVTPCFLRKS